MPETLQQTLERAAASNPSRRITFVHSAGSDESLTYYDLFHQARAVAGHLLSQGVRPGEPVLLSLATNVEFVRGFWGCLFAGAVPVPLPADSLNRRAGPARDRLAAVERLMHAPRLTNLPPHTSPAAPICNPSPSETALIQFSSGSTGTPNGVVLSHLNILANLRAIVTGARLESDDIALTWMPLHHDLGLIGFLLAATFCACDLVLLDTAAFIRRPLLWLDALEQHRATVTAAPNFGQALLLPQLAGARLRDLSRVRLVVNGAEPISVDIMRAFLAALAPHGLRPESMFPVYGLAEATLAVAFPALGQGPRVACFDRRSLRLSSRAELADPSHPQAVEIVSEGQPVEHCQIRIVDSQDRLLPEGVNGHIQVRGPHVMRQYYGQTTRDVFAEDWLRTGDVGLILDGDIFVTGRAKDILFVNGENYYSTDIENLALQVAGMERRRVAACATRGSHDSADQLLLFVSSSNPQCDADVLAAVRRRLQTNLGLTPHAIVPLPSSQFPLTTSGKIQRYSLRERFEEGGYHQMAELAAGLIAQASCGQAPPECPRTATERALHSIWSRQLGLKPDEFGIHDAFHDLGGRSLTAALILSAVDALYGVRLPPQVFEEHPTIAAMAAQLEQTSRMARLPGARKSIFRG